MAAYVSVYRKIAPNKADLAHTSEAATHDPVLRRFLEEYRRESCFLDWGDDPSFFAACEFLDDVRAASWGVCRRNLRKKLRKGDVVVFFCARQNRPERRWDYYFIGFGTVAVVITREMLWGDPDRVMYRRFFNRLARPLGSTWVQDEVFHPYHEDWQSRMPGYVLFEQCADITEFNFTSPPAVATYAYGGVAPERWRGDLVSAELQNVLFVRHAIRRRLRTSPTGYAHPHICLTNDPKETLRIRADLGRVWGIIHDKA